MCRYAWVCPSSLRLIRLVDRNVDGASTKKAHLGRSGSGLQRQVRDHTRDPTSLTLCLVSEYQLTRLVYSRRLEAAKRNVSHGSDLTAEHDRVEFAVHRDVLRCGNHYLGPTFGRSR
jgi:hypothetical protein